MVLIRKPKKVFCPDCGDEWEKRATIADPKSKNLPQACRTCRKRNVIWSMAKNGDK